MKNTNNPLNIRSKKEKIKKKQPKRWTWTKPKDKPKRPLSAYNIFFKHTRSRIVEGLSEDAGEEEIILSIEALLLNAAEKKKRDRRSHGKISFGNLASAVSKKWKNIDDHRMALFQRYADLDKERYFIELGNWKAKKESEVLNTSLPGSSSTDDNDSKHSLMNLDVDLEPRLLPELPKSRERTTNSQLKTIPSFPNTPVTTEVESEAELQDIVKQNEELVEQIDCLEYELSKTDKVDGKNDQNCNGKVDGKSHGDYNEFILNSFTMNPLYSVFPFTVESSLHQMQNLQRIRLLSENFCGPLSRYSGSPLDEEIFSEAYDDLDKNMAADLNPAPFNEVVDDSSSKWFLKDVDL